MQWGRRDEDGGPQWINEFYLTAQSAEEAVEKFVQLRWFPLSVHKTCWVWLISALKCSLLGVLQGLRPEDGVENLRIAKHINFRMLESYHDLTC